MDTPRRDSVLDALRTLAVLLMISSHTTRLIVWDARREWSRLALLTEPVTASLFLYLVGASLAASWRRASAAGRTRAQWWRHQALRAAPLWALSCLFYTLEEGFAMPDAVFLSGILATIAYAILLVMIPVAAPGRGPVLAALALMLAAAHLWLDGRGLQVFLLNAGNSPLLPLILFATLGAWVFSIQDGRRWAVPAMAIVAVVIFVTLVRIYGFEALFSKPLGRYDTARVFYSGPPGARLEKSIPYYNLRPILDLIVLSLILMAQALLSLIRPALDRAGKFLFPLGRHSLDAYILHLSLLALLVVTTGSRRPLAKTWQGDAVFCGAVLICYFWALGREKIRLRQPR